MFKVSDGIVPRVDKEGHTEQSNKRARNLVDTLWTGLKGPIPMLLSPPTSSAFSHALDDVANDSDSVERDD
jgi:hypothetical protein